MAIVERVEALMETCRALETEIEHSRPHAALKEAFAPEVPISGLKNALFYP